MVTSLLLTIRGTAFGILAAIASGAYSAPAARPSGLPATHPAQMRGQQLLAILNRGGKETIRAHITETFAPEAVKAAMDSQLVPYGFRRYVMGQTRFVRFDRESPTKGRLIFESALLGRRQALSIEVEQKPPFRVTRVGLPEELPGEIPVPASDDRRAAMIDSFAQRLASQNFFSGSILLARDGVPIFVKAFGPAERRFNVSNTAGTKFVTASITKSITALAVAQLVEQGKLSWEDPLSKFLPDFPDAASAKKIRIKHLLSNTSGLGDTIGSQKKETMTNFRNLADFMAAAPRNPPEFEPGTGSLYSNLGFLLLGRIIEIAAGKDYYGYVEQHIFRKAGMNSAGMVPPDEVVADLAYNYDIGDYLNPAKHWDVALITRARAAPYGGAYMTVHDLLKFDTALRSGVLIKPETWALMSAPKPELGSPHYGYGLDREEFGNIADRKAVGHGGNQPGTCGVWARTEDTAAPYTIIVLSNSGMFACWPVSNYMFNLLPTG